MLLTPTSPREPTAGVVTATSVGTGPDELAILARFGIGSEALLGAGGESRVFALGDDRVLRIFGGLFDHDAQALIATVNQMASVDIGVLTPLVLDVGSHGSQQYTVDRRVPGESLAHWLSRDHSPERRTVVLMDYLGVAGRLRRLPVPAATRGRFSSLGAPDRVPPGASLVELLRRQAEVGIEFSDGLLDAAVPDLADQLDELFTRLGRRRVQPAFVHADYFPGNVMVAEGRVSGVLDISVHALSADPVMDEVAAVCFLEHVTYPQVGEDVGWLEAELASRLGPDRWLVEAYRRWYAAYYAMDRALIDWCARQFERPW